MSEQDIAQAKRKSVSAMAKTGHSTTASRERSMKKTLLSALLVLPLFGGTAVADQMLAMQSGCLGCHKVDTKLIGPAFKDVAAKYAGDPSQIDRLAAKVKSGSTPGEPLIWGSVAMPPSPAKPESIHKVVEWVMTLK